MCAFVKSNISPTFLGVSTEMVSPGFLFLDNMEGRYEAKDPLSFVLTHLGGW